MAKLQAATLVKKYPFTRRRMEVDLYFNPPMAEAKKIILAHAEYMASKEVRKEYRSEKEHAPLFHCHLCHERYPSLRQYEKVRGGSVYKKYGTILY